MLWFDATKGWPEKADKFIVQLADGRYSIATFLQTGAIAGGECYPIFLWNDVFEGLLPQDTVRRWRKILTRDKLKLIEVVSLAIEGLEDARGN